MAAIVRDGAGQHYTVCDAGPDLAHVWIGTPCHKDGSAKAGARKRLVHRMGCVVITTPFADGLRA